MTHLRHAALAAVAATLFLGACSDAPSPLAPTETAAPALSRGAQTASAPAPDRSTTRYEIDFMQDMIDHHHMAIMMAEVCLRKAVHEELRSMCEDIIEAQQAEIRQMQGWLRAWYGISYQPEMKPGDMKMIERLAALPPAEFEIEFMQMMIKHHTKAVKEGERCLDRAYHAELRQLCQNIVSAQTQEIAQLRQWLCQWYGICK